MRTIDVPISNMNVTHREAPYFSHWQGGNKCQCRSSDPATTLITYWQGALTCVFPIVCFVSEISLWSITPLFGPCQLEIFYWEIPPRLGSHSVTRVLWETSRIVLLPRQGLIVVRSSSAFKLCWNPLKETYSIQLCVTRKSRNGLWRS